MTHPRPLPRRPHRRRSHQCGLLVPYILCIIALGLSGCSEEETPTDIPAPDTTPPAMVQDLVATAEGDSVITLTWTATGDDGATGTADTYDIRYATTEIDDASWDDATEVGGEPTPAVAGTEETFPVPDLRPDQNLHFALVAIDDDGNVSALSNVTFLDVEPPSPIFNLTVFAITSQTVELTWRAPDEDGPLGHAAWYELRFSRDRLTEENWLDAELIVDLPEPQSGGNTDRYTVTDLEPDTEYYFALRAWDAASNPSVLSNIVSVSTTPGQWWGGFAELGMDNDVHALVSHDGQLIAGGRFTQAGGIEAAQIAAWNGSQWSPLGSGVRGEMGAVGIRALTVWEDKLVAGGDFSEAGDVSAENIAMWDGADWLPFGTGTDGTVTALMPFGRHLVAGGVFFTVGGQEIYSIAAWNGLSWESMGWNTERNGPIASLGVFEGDLIVGGAFDRAGTVSANNIARWNGESWAPLGGGVTEGDQFRLVVTALTLFEGDLIAAGAFERAGNVSVNHIARWNGAVWQPLGAGIGFEGTEVAPGIYDLIVHNDRLIVAGEFTSAGEILARNIAVWDGKSWGTFGAGLGGAALALQSQDGALFVGGRFENAGRLTSPRIARWDE